eukprot:6155836-Amphidinium_carterae.1
MGGEPASCANVGFAGSSGSSLPGGAFASSSPAFHKLTEHAHMKWRKDDARLHRQIAVLEHRTRVSVQRRLLNTV